MKKSFFNTEDVAMYIAMVGSFVCIVILRKEPSQQSLFKDILSYVVVYYIGKKREQLTKNGDESPKK